MHNKPLVSILLPVYNSAPFLADCLSSIQKQTYSNWELIIINDGSTDNTRQILESFAADSRIRIYSRKSNSGIAASLNQAVSLAKGQFLARMDADDVMYPHRLSRQVRYLLSHPDAVVIGGQCRLIDTQNKSLGKKTFPLDHRSIYQLAFLRSPLQHPAIMINRLLVPAQFTWYQSSRVPAEDLDLYFRLFRFGLAANLPQTVIKYRQNPEGLTFQNPRITFLRALAVRLNAVSIYGYRPSLVTWVTFIVQSLLVNLLPGKYIYTLYHIAINPSSLIDSLKLRFQALKTPFSFGLK